MVRWEVDVSHFGFAVLTAFAALHSPILRYSTQETTIGIVHFTYTHRIHHFTQRYYTSILFIIVV